MTIGCKTGGPGEGISYLGSHGQTVRVGRSARRSGVQIRLGYILAVQVHCLDR